MSISDIKARIGDFAKDTRINFPKIFTPDGAQGLSEKQIFTIALSCAYSLDNKDLVAAIKSDGAEHLDADYIQAAQSAASIMAMNNVYYRFIHLVEDSEFAQMPAGLRMQVIMNSGIDKKDFELLALAVSAINGCGMCMDSHVKTLLKEGVTKTSIQSAIKIASVVTAADQSLKISEIEKE
ncbi:MAG: carboxymuconolactone decarboxylase family protein [Pseudomonadota bacterium]